MEAVRQRVCVSEPLTRNSSEHEVSANDETDTEQSLKPEHGTSLQNKGDVIAVVIGREPQEVRDFAYLRRVFDDSGIANDGGPQR
jgi:hypothetical protein